MTKYKKKPVVIDAIKFTGDNQLEVCRFLQNLAGASGLVTFEHGDMRITTLEGTMTASPGDYIIVGIKKEIYPCKPDIFEATYSQAEEEDLQAEEDRKVGQMVRKMEDEAKVQEKNLALQVIPFPNHPQDLIRWIVEGRGGRLMGPGAKTPLAALEEAFTKGETKK